MAAKIAAGAAACSIRELATDNIRAAANFASHFNSQLLHWNINHYIASFDPVFADESDVLDLLDYAVRRRRG